MTTPIYQAGPASGPGPLGTLERFSTAVSGWTLSPSVDLTIYRPDALTTVVYLSLMHRVSMTLRWTDLLPARAVGG